MTTNIGTTESEFEIQTETTEDGYFDSTYDEQDHLQEEPLIGQSNTYRGNRERMKMELTIESPTITNLVTPICNKQQLYHINKSCF